MKKLLFVIVGFVMLNMSSTEAKSFRGGVDFNYFYATLSPYGEWIEIDYDVYAWRPNSTRMGWSPYREGRWVWSDYGWFWDSYEPFGWATYHYGRWHFDDYYGWLWVPGYEWGPAWVEWRYNDAYIGWAPLPPYASFKMHLGIHFSISWHSHYSHWNFVSYGHFNNYNLHNYYVHNNHVNKFFKKTKYRTNYYYDGNRVVNGGVNRTYVERKGGYRIANRNIEQSNNLSSFNDRRRDEDSKIRVYRPSDSDRSKYAKIDRSGIVKSERKTSLKTDKIISRDRTNSAVQRGSDAGVERNSKKDVIKRKQQSDQNRDAPKSGSKINNKSRGNSQSSGDKVIERSRTSNQESSSVRKSVNNSNRDKSKSNRSTQRESNSSSGRVTKRR